MAEKGKQNESDRVAEDKPANDPETGFDPSSENIGEKKNTQQGSIVHSVAPSTSASDSVAAPATLISQLQEARRLVNFALDQNVYMVEEMNRRHGCSPAEIESIRKFLRSSLRMFRDIHQMLQWSNPVKEKFSALIVTDDYNYKYSHNNVLSITGNWDVEVVETGELAIKCHLDGKSFDLIILHDNLAGLDGPQMAGWLRDHNVKSFVVGVTAFERDVFVKSGLEFCLEKPMTVSYSDIAVAISQEFEKATIESISGILSVMDDILSGTERIIGIDDGDHVSV